ncbi:MAG: sarcosine oxidase subunit alpha, partial [Actinobacteria bacterium]|nr:sarcosine oxidase subunit alpha [Actinomycetota bacterium]
MSGGWSPAVHLYAQAGGRARWEPAQACFVPGPLAQTARTVGACHGAFTLAACLAEGRAAGAAAARAAGFGDGVPRTDLPWAEDARADSIRAVWLAPGSRPVSRASKAFVDLREDVTAADLALAVREGFQSIEHVKRYTTLGMGVDQGKLSNVNGLGVVATVLGVDVAQVGTTTYRPMVTPVSFGALAGRDVGPLADVTRLTPLQRWHEEAGARFENVGQWRRAWYYPRPGESMRAAVARECRAVRRDVGILDYSTLGKIDIQGPDALELLNRVYTTSLTRLPVGRCRYGLMLGEDGMIFDDGVTARLGPQHYFMFTTTSGTARVLGWLERWLQTEWPALQVYLTSVSDHWCDIAIAGPKSRALVAAVCPDIDFAPTAFPFMAVRTGTVAGVPARVFRISFSGELSYEINVPACYGRAVWEALIAAGAPSGITPYGTEALHVLRAEKGLAIVGQETDGSVTPGDLGLDRLVAPDKDCLGKRSLARPDARRPDRKQLVGLLTLDPTEVLPEGGQVVAEPNAPIPVPMIGHVTSSYFSANVGRSIALALVKGGRARLGQTVYVPRLDRRTVPALIVSPVFYDPEEKRRDG